MHDKSKESSLGEKVETSIGKHSSRKKLGVTEKSFTEIVSELKQMIDENIIYVHNHNILVWEPDEELNPGLKERFNEANIDYHVTILPGEDADVESLKTITNYGMVFFSTHGANGEWLQTGEKQVDDQKYKTEIEDGNIAFLQEYEILPDLSLRKHYPKYSVNDRWFNNNLNGRFANTISANLSCESCDTEDLWNAFEIKGAETYFGFKGATWSKFSRDRAYELAENLRNADNTTGEAYTPITDWLWK